MQVGVADCVTTSAWHAAMTAMIWGDRSGLSLTTS